MPWEELGKTQIKIDPSQNDVQLSGSNVEQMPGEEIPEKGVLVGGSNGTDFVPIKVAADGSLYVSGLTIGDVTVTDVGIDQITPGANNVVAAIDQTTPGTTNKVVAELSGSKVAEEFTEVDADVNNVLTFQENIEYIEIYHEEATWQQFVINGITKTVPAGGWRGGIEGTPAKTVTIPAGVNCIVGRLV